MSTDNDPPGGEQVLPPLPPCDLRSIDDLLTPAEQEELRADLARIHAVIHPCWVRASGDAERSS